MKRRRTSTSPRNRRALTPALSLGERGPARMHHDGQGRPEPLPLPAGEGRGEGPRELHLRNRQHALRPDLHRLRRATLRLLADHLRLPAYSLGVTFLSPAAMARLNWTHLRHEGPTDVITFDHREAPAAPLHGELFICPAVAAAQAAEFGVPWPEELVRYVVHGVLHLLGHDDRTPPARRRMKREENRLVRALAREFDLRAPAAPTSLPA